MGICGWALAAAAEAEEAEEEFMMSGGAICISLFVVELPFLFYFTFRLAEDCSTFAFSSSIFAGYAF